MHLKFVFRGLEVLTIMKALVKGLWQFCSFLFWPRWGR